MEWPLKNEKTGKPLTTPTNQSIFLAAIEAAATERPNQVSDWKDRLSNCNNWRNDYVQLLHDFGIIQASCSPETVVAMCQAGLQAAMESFVLRTKDDSLLSLSQAFQQDDNLTPLETETYHGTQQSVSNITQFPLALPQNGNPNVQWVTGNTAVEQLQAYETYGCMEPSATEHAKAICQSHNVSSFVKSKTFCLLGLTSEMGPAAHLLKIPGAHVLGVARAGSKLEQFIKKHQQQGCTNSILQIPQGGANLLHEAPQIARWIVETTVPDRTLVIMPLAYMDGEANVRVTVAMDAIVEYVRQHRTISLVYLTSPTTVYAIPPQAAQEAKRRYENNNWSNLIHMATFGKWLQPSNTWQQQQQQQDNSLIVLNGLASLQGPNYALAKIMQQWRCMVAQQCHKLVVAAPHAPPTRTYSVQHNPTAAAGLEGLQYFPPMVSFDVDACSSLMTAIVLNQVNQPHNKVLQHPMQLFWDGSVHGGSWRCPYSTESCLVLAYLLGRTIATPGSCPAKIETTNDAEEEV